ncbi:TATA-box-binding protein [Halobium palmae]|uniref:TATA-box-binding protein n=1 Tax=Halobium palmae TaxID=1776492 RepID=A0ABD5RWR1_9EURY
MNNSSIVNVVGGGSIHRELNLPQVYQDFPDGDLEYEPEAFAALVIRYDSPKGTVMLYTSGKYSLAGARSIEQAYEVNTRFVESMEQMLGHEITDQEFEVRYLVGTADFGTELNLNTIIPILGVEQIEYEPEQFPGLFYRPPGRDWFSLLFGSGKVVFSGVKDEKELEQAYREVENKISQIL